MGLSKFTRRTFSGLLGSVLAAQTGKRPNILWVTCEDTGPQIGAYGDTYADTPNLDKLAARGMLYRAAWSNAPVCAPARTTIISGLCPPSTGSEHMRSMTKLPAGIRMFPCYLRDSGYYTSNNAKEDYNLEHTGMVWDESSNKAHWRNRKSGQPFFSVFNFLITHESQIRTRPHKWVHDISKARIPAYHPDIKEAREDWAQYYDNITTMDNQVAGILRQLEQDGLAEDTIVFFYGDHGSGMPRSKRWPYNSGLHVPLIVYIPEKFRHLAPKDYVPGAKSNRLASFVDLAPTVLSLAGIKPPEHLQGHALMGEYPAPEQPFIYGFRGRMDERYDMSRSVRDSRYSYMRNYMPHKMYGQHVAYMFETPTTAAWKKLNDEGKLNAAQKHFWETKPPEELYDLENDRDEVHNLAKSPAHQDILKRMRKAQQDLALKIRDVGFLPEDEIHRRSKGSTPYEMGHDEKRYPFKRIFAAAELASSLEPGVTSKLLAALKDDDSAVRYWAAMGILMRGVNEVKKTREALLAALADTSPSVRVVAADALGQYGNEADLKQALAVLVELGNQKKEGVYVAIAALNALDGLGKKAVLYKNAINALPPEDSSVTPRANSYVARLLESITERL